MSTDKILKRDCIVFDIDDTLAHFVRPVLSELHRITGRFIHPDDMVEGKWLHHFLTKEELEGFLPYVFNKTFYSMLQPTAIVEQRHGRDYRTLREQFDFHAVTARREALGEHAHAITAEWLGFNNLVFQGVTICHPDQLKSQVMPRNTRAVLDDSAKVVLDAAAHGVHGFLVDQPWNRHIKVHEYPNVYRVTQENALSEMVRVLAH